MQDTYLALLQWLRSLVREAATKGLLSPPECQTRERALALRYEETGREVIVQLGDKTFGARGPTLEGILFRYFGCPERNRLLNILSDGPGLRANSLKLPDGTEMLCGAFVRNLLALELFLNRGTTAAAVTGCSLADFERRRRRSEGAPVAGTPGTAGLAYRWSSSPGGKEEELSGSERLVRAIEGYAAHFRPSQVRDARRGNPLFAVQGGGGLKSLTASLAIFFKLARGKPAGLLVSPATVEAVRDSLYETLG
jgi:hypothetical protein